MTTMTNFSMTAERIGKTPSEKRAVEAMANALGSVENAIADGDTHYKGHCFIDDAEQYASEGLDSLDKRTLNHISDERINELVHEVALTFDYLEEYNEPTTSPEANNDKENTVTTAQTSAFIPSSATSMSFEDFIDGMYLFASKYTGEIAIDRVAVRVESLYNDITFRAMVFEYRQAVLTRDDLRKRIFRTEFMKKNGSYRTRYNAYCGNCKARGPQYIANGIGMNELSRRECQSAFDKALDAWNRLAGEHHAD